ncbi:hypothetical protein PYW07_006606 [Mythimna separata]|uniref:Regulatory protein zeste n=1 Tax=Mythimna separata TaxID=271217 RepID=A0AAD7YX13_MYTSE|nr:hypothetical protein PYW07_006606 [Mythimna separata]
MKFFSLLEKAVTDNEIQAHRIYNMDESGLNTVQKPPKVFVSKGKKQVGAVTSVERGEHFTVVACANAIGNYVPPALIIPRKNYKAEYFDGTPPGSLELCHPSGDVESRHSSPTILVPNVATHLLIYGEQSQVGDKVVEQELSENEAVEQGQIENEVQIDDEVVGQEQRGDHAVGQEQIGIEAVPEKICEEDKEKMMSRPTHQQLETLVDFLEQNPGIAKGLLRTAHAKQQTKRKWDEIAVSLNALGGAQKDGKGWAKYWADKKCALKKICAQHAQSMRRTGGGTAENLPALTPIDQRLVAVMGGLQFAAGDSHVAANPFPSTSQSQNDTPSEIVVPIQDFYMDAIDLEVHVSPSQNVETARAPTPREHSPRRTSVPPRQRVRSTRSILDQERERLAERESEG